MKCILYCHTLASQDAGKEERAKCVKDVKDVQTVFIGCTRNIGSPGGRGQEVRIWLESHPVCDRFVVLDDNHKKSFEENLFGEKLLPHGAKGIFIETKLGGDSSMDGIPAIEQGLTEDHVETAVQFFNISR